MNNKNIPGFDGYSITPDGIVYHGAKRIKTYIVKSGTPIVRLKKDSKYETMSVGKLIAITFLPAKKSDTDMIAYRDGNNTNYSLDNIYWTTRHEAFSNYYRGKTRYSEHRINKLRKAVCRKVEAQIADVNNGLIMTTKYNSIREAADAVGVTPASLVRCLKNANAKCAGYYWKYSNEE